MGSKGPGTTGRIFGGEKVLYDKNVGRQFAKGSIKHHSERKSDEDRARIEAAAAKRARKAARYA